MNQIASLSNCITVLIGEDHDPARRGDKQLVARSDCSYRLPDAATVERCIAALRDSDDQLKERPERLRALWDYQSAYFIPDTDTPAGGGTLVLGIAWYNQKYYRSRKDAWLSVVHKRIYASIGISLSSVSITHWTID
ncbi:hypothetical protein [Sphaerisporangium album]|uniref:hypothetical protein n=1 Tax=Sphaerisporangium album TaxID=509200 RepID=UPI0011C03369|nr:hypothetical protein [Sphaerisporangium album]